MHSCTGLRRESVLGGATGGAPRRRGSIRGIGTLLAMPSRGRQPVERSISVQHRLCTGWRRNPWHENHTSGTRHVSCRRPVAQQEYCYCEAYLPGAAKGQGGRGGLAWGETLRAAPGSAGSSHLTGYNKRGTEPQRDIGADIEKPPSRSPRRRPGTGGCAYRASTTSLPHEDHTSTRVTGARGQNGRLCA